MRTVVFLIAAASLGAQPRVDNVLVQMVPPGTTSLAGAHMDQFKTTPFYRKLVDQQKLSQIDRFAKETGFDPRRDVREMLFADTFTGGVLLARGNFPLHPAAGGAQPIRHGRYTIHAINNAGFCILDGTLAAAGNLRTLEAALDEWTSGSHAVAKPLLGYARSIDPQSQVWGVSMGFAGFLADNIPRAGSGIDFSKIFRGLQNTWFQASFSTGFQAIVHGLTNSEQDAANLRDTTRGLIGFGRLSVPENQEEMLKLWDSITVEQDGRNLSIHADVPQVLVDQVVHMISSGPLVGGRGLGLRIP